MSHTGWGNYQTPTEGPFASALSYVLLIAGFFYLNANLNNLLLKIIFAVLFWGGWIAVIYVCAIKPIFNKIKKLFK
jgi:hypothetical protein